MGKELDISLNQLAEPAASETPATETASRATTYSEELLEEIVMILRKMAEKLGVDLNEI